MPQRLNSAYPITHAPVRAEVAERESPRPAPEPARARSWAEGAAPPAADDGFSPATPSEPTSTDGTPLYKQSDPRWAHLSLGTGSSFAEAGCAVTSIAMAISKISGKPITPKELDAHLDKRKGYSGNSVKWRKAAAARGLDATQVSFRLKVINLNLEAGRPVVIGVDYKEGSAGGSRGTDHWICLTRREVDSQGKVSYWANDPGTGNEIKLTADSKGRLRSYDRGALGQYTTTDLLMVFRDKLTAP